MYLRLLKFWLTLSAECPVILMKNKKLSNLFLLLICLLLLSPLISEAKPARLRISFSSVVESVYSDLAFLCLQQYNYLRAQPVYSCEAVDGKQFLEFELALEEPTELILYGEGISNNFSIHLYLKPGAELSLFIDNEVRLGQDKSQALFNKKFKFSGSLAALNYYWAHYEWRNSTPYSSDNRFLMGYEKRNKHAATLKQTALQHFDSVAKAEFAWIKTNYPDKGKEGKQLHRLLRDVVRYKTAAGLLSVLDNSSPGKEQKLDSLEFEAVIKKYHQLESGLMYLWSFNEFSNQFWKYYYYNNSLSVSHHFPTAYIDDAFINKSFTPSLIWQDLFDEWQIKIKENKSLSPSQELWAMMQKNEESGQLIKDDFSYWFNQLTGARKDSTDFSLIKSTGWEKRMQYLIALNRLLQGYQPSAMPLSEKQLEQFSAQWAAVDPALTNRLKKDALLLRKQLQTLPRERNKYRHLPYLEEEAQFRELVAQYEGKVVVIFQMPHYYDARQLALQLSYLKIMKERLKGEEVVFIKLIHERTRTDYPEIVRSYMLALMEQHETANTYYINKSSLSPFLNFYLSWNNQGSLQIIGKDGFKLPITIENTSSLSQPADKLALLSLREELSHEGENDLWLSLFDRNAYQVFYDQGDYLMMTTDKHKLTQKEFDLFSASWHGSKAAATLTLTETGTEKTFRTSYNPDSFELSLINEKESRKYRLYEAGKDLIVLKRLKP